MGRADICILTLMAYRCGTGDLQRCTPVTVHAAPPPVSQCTGPQQHGPPDRTSQKASSRPAQNTTLALAGACGP